MRVQSGLRLSGTLTLAWPDKEVWPLLAGDVSQLSIEALKHRPSLRALAPSLAMRAGRVSASWQAARLYEEQRWQDFSNTAQEILEPLATAGIEPHLLGGSRLGGEYLRHVHDLDFCVATDRREEALALLRPHAVRGWRHPGGLRIGFHRRPLSLRHYRIEPSDWLQERRFDLPCRVLRPEIELVRVLAQAGATAKGPVWVLDAQHLLGRELDWTLVLARASQGRMVLPALAGLWLLREVFEEPIPVLVMEALQQVAEQRNRGDWEAWWHGLRSRHTRVTMWRCGTLWEKLALIRWVLRLP